MIFEAKFELVAAVATVAMVVEVAALWRGSRGSGSIDRLCIVDFITIFNMHSGTWCEN